MKPFAASFTEAAVEHSAAAYEGAEMLPMATPPLCTLAAKIANGLPVKCLAICSEETSSRERPASMACASSSYMPRRVPQRTGGMRRTRRFGLVGAVCRNPEPGVNNQAVSRGTEDSSAPNRSYTLKRRNSRNSLQSSQWSASTQVLSGTGFASTGLGAFQNGFYIADRSSGRKLAVFNGRVKNEVQPTVLRTTGPRDDS